MNSLSQMLSRILNSRDELSPRNFHGNRWALFLASPLAVIIGDMRYFNLEIAVWGFESYELMLYSLGFGWLVLSFIPKRLILPLFRCAAVFSALLLPFQFLLTDSTGRLAVFMAFQLLNGICAACAFFLFCFELNNVERLFGMVLLQFYKGFYYTVWRTFPAVQTAGRTWVSAVFMTFFLVTVFLCGRQRSGLLDMPNEDQGLEQSRLAKARSGALFVIGLEVVFYIIMCMINHIEYLAENGIATFPYGLGAFISIALVFIIMLFYNRSALYIWLMFLAFSLLGLGVLVFDSAIMRFTGSLIYGAGAGLGYIIIYYLCAGAIKQSKSQKLFRLFCFIAFIESVFISGVFSKVFASFERPSHYLALVVVLVLCSVCFLLIPFMQKKLFEADWTDGFYLADMPEYAPVLAQAEKADAEEHLGLSPRERDVFALLLKNMPLKTIAQELGIAFNTVNSHYRAIYRKLGITSKGELLLKYGKKV